MDQAVRAQQHLEKALATAERVYGDRHHELADYLSNLGNAYASAGDTKRARASYTRSLELREQALGSDHVKLADALTNLGFSSVRTKPAISRSRFTSEQRSSRRRRTALATAASGSRSRSSASPARRSGSGTRQ